MRARKRTRLDNLHVYEGSAPNNDWTPCFAWNRLLCLSGNSYSENLNTRHVAASEICPSKIPRREVLESCWHSRVFCRRLDALTAHPFLRFVSRLKRACHSKICVRPATRPLVAPCNIFRLQTWQDSRRIWLRHAVHIFRSYWQFLS